MKPTSNKKSKAKIFDIKLFPMDTARVAYAALFLLFRVKRITPTGEKYSGKIKGGAVITANHTSFSDPVIVGSSLWYRRLFFLAAEAVMSGKFKSFMLSQAGAIRLDRNAADIEAIKKAVETVKAGRLLAIFPQGGIKDEANISTIKSGAVLIALRGGVPIIPMHILPRKKWYSRQRVIIGNAVNPSEFVSGKFPTTADIDRITAALMQEMRGLNEHI